MKKRKFFRKSMLFLLNEQYMLDFFSMRLKNINRRQGKLEKIKIYPIKNHYSKAFVHIVCFYKLYFKGGKRTVSIIGAAHSDGSRGKLYKRQKYIYEHGFNKGNFRVPPTLFYYEPLRAMFYLAAPGGNLYSRIIDKDFKTVNWAMPKVAAWLAKFHRMKVDKSDYFPNRLTVKAIDPTDILGGESFLVKKYKKQMLKLFQEIKKWEKNILTEPRKHSTIVHGDIHPENIIINKIGNKREFTVIDFTEMRIAPPMYDIASFIQQLESMSREINAFSANRIKKLQRKFLESYLKAAREKFTPSIKNQLHLYRAWAALRGAIYFIGINRERRIKEFVNETKDNLKKIKI